MTYPIYRNAELFADMAHSSIFQKRKYTGHPYIEHCRNVAYLTQIADGSKEMIETAYLHDVLEDVTPKNPIYNAELILKEFGQTVLDYVTWLTNVPHERGNRETRKAIDRENLCCAPSEVKTIKLADLIDNSLTIIEYDPSFAKIYLKEKRLLMDVLIDGNSQLWNLADSILMRHGY